MTNQEMFEGIQALSQVNETGLLGYACARNLRKLLDESREFMAERDRLLAQYGKAKGNGQYELSPDQQIKFASALKPFGDIEHDVSIMRVSEDIFCSGNLTSRQMFALTWMVDE